MFKQILSLYLCVCVTSWASTTLAETPPTTEDAQATTVLAVGTITNIQPSERTALLQLLKMAIRERSKGMIQVSIKDLNDDGLRSLAQEHGAPVVITIDATRIGHRLIVLMRALRNGAVEAESLKLESIDDLPAAIDRMMEAIFTEKSYEETATMATLTGEEVRIHRKKYGEFFWGVGLEQGTTLSVASHFNFGAMLRTSYEMTHWRIDSDLSVLGSHNGSQKYNHVMWSWTLGGAYIIGDGNIAPYVDAGMGIGAQVLIGPEGGASLTPGVGSTGMGGSGYGVGALFYVGAGLELFRFYETRLLIGARIVLPAYNLRTDQDLPEGDWTPSVRLTTAFVW
jgi:hypothetical protein